MGIRKRSATIRWLVIALAVGLSFNACATADVTPSPQPDPSEAVASRQPDPSTAGTATERPTDVLASSDIPPTGSPSASPGTITIAFVPQLFEEGPTIGPISNAGDYQEDDQTTLVDRFIHRALYRYDDRSAPVPDLAAAPCEVADGGLEITCSIVETTFHDGSSVTAEDVAFIFELGRTQFDIFDSQSCPFGFFAFVACIENVASATAINERTVRFRLEIPDARFFTTTLPTVLIESKASIEQAYEAFRAATEPMGPEPFEELDRKIGQAFEREPPDCDGAILEETEAMLQAARLQGPDRRAFPAVPSGSLDACRYLGRLGSLVGSAIASLHATGMEAIAAAYPALPASHRAIGTGAWRIVSEEPGTGLVLGPWEGYDGEPPATPNVVFRTYTDSASAAAALLSGEVDWLPVYDTETYRRLTQDMQLEFVDYLDPTTLLSVDYNLRADRILSDERLRGAIELCIDKPATVESATEGVAGAVYSPYPPSFWAHDPGLPRPTRDVPAARGLIEQAGWETSESGVYEKDGSTLTFTVWATDRVPERKKFLELMQLQLVDCGMDMQIELRDPDEFYGPLFGWPHVPPGQTEPFDAVFSSVVAPLDPDYPDLSSTNATSEEAPFNANFTGFSDPHVDDLLRRGLETYDIPSRTSIYRELQRIITDENLFLFAWAPRVRVALRPGFATVGGPIDLTSPGWDWRLEDLIRAP